MCSMAYRRCWAPSIRHSRNTEHLPVLLAAVLARVLFTTLGYTVEETDQVVEERIAPVLMTYLASHGPRLARARGHEPSG